jgi:transcriptional regulator NrdR family protein
MSHLKVIKKDGSVRKFNHQKIFCGIYNAVREVKNMDRGKATVIAQNLQDEVEKKLWGANEKIESKKISVVVLEVLLERAPNVFLTYLAYVNRMKLSKQTEQFSNKYWKSLIKKAVD